MSVATDVAAAMSALKSAAGSSKLDTSNPFGFITDQAKILNALNKATNAAYDNQMTEANLGLNRAEDTAYSNTQNAINELRRTMTGASTSGANQGAAGATALQAILGLGQQNNALVTEGLQNIQKIAGERAAALADNAATSIDKANSAINNQASAANQKYTADQNRSAAALEALGALAGVQHTNEANKTMNKDTNTANKQIASTTQKQSITYYNK